MFILADRRTGKRCLLPAKTTDESLIVSTDGFRASEPPKEDDAFDREYVVHGDGDDADDEVHVNTCESHASLTRRWVSPHRGISKDKLTQSLGVFQRRRELYRKAEKMRSNTPFERRSELNSVLRASDLGLRRWISSVAKIR
ncbi:ISH4 transposase [Natrinema pallidum DSM 3751]|uniref:ISH4 transposase n=1 Tax=Natrinema pallidum DSM 3751 TaxID=1227495 RepID=L9Z8C0_9EURY|nr:ISH4 transposase [Natrinema pallidum DSM 3751]